MKPPLEIMKKSLGILKGKAGMFGNVLKDVLDKNFSPKDKADMFLLHAAALGWLLVGAANCVGIFFNKELKAKEKKFLIPQEATDVAVNLVTYYSVTTPLVLGVKKLADKGAFRLSEVGTDAFKEQKTGLATLAAILGAVVCSNIITPIVRNKVAANRQKKYLETLQDSSHGITTVLNTNKQTPMLSMGGFLKYANSKGGTGMRI